MNGGCGMILTLGLSMIVTIVGLAWLDHCIEARGEWHPAAGLAAVGVLGVLYALGVFTAGRFWQ